MSNTTSMGGAGSRFPVTRWSVIQDACARGSGDCGRALDELCRLYWKPVYAYIRAVRGVSNEDAKDLAQEFFAEMLDGRMLARFSPERGGFRRYLRGALDLLLRERHRRDAAQKRGGGAAILPLDERELSAIESASAGDSPESAFDRQWKKALLQHAVNDLREELIRVGKEAQFRVFERHDLSPTEGSPPGYERIAEELGLSRIDVRNYLFRCRRRLRELLLARIRDYVDTENEAAQELALFFQR